MLATGLLLLPMSVTVGVGSLASGPLTARLGPRPPMIAGLALGRAGRGCRCSLVGIEPSGNIGIPHGVAPETRQ